MESRGFARVLKLKQNYVTDFTKMKLRNGFRKHIENVDKISDSVTNPMTRFGFFKYNSFSRAQGLFRKNVLSGFELSNYSIGFCLKIEY